MVVAESGLAVGAVQAAAQFSLPTMVYVPARDRLSGMLSGVNEAAPVSTRMRTRNWVSCCVGIGLPIAIRGTTMLIVPSALKPLAGSAAVPGLRGNADGFVPVP
ncbi:MAG: hypothetical protein DMG53_07400 [Acidobacteria bacterium]|nr:MAG: hypothetical protein DMG53_07400 [Acidobacteriota bacterium]